MWNLFNLCNLTYSMPTKVSLSVWRDEAHGRFNANNPHEDDEEKEDVDNIDNTPIEHSNPALPLSSLQASLTDPSSAKADAESNRTRAAGLQDIDFNGDNEDMAGAISQKVSASGTSVTNSSIDQDQEMWDIVSEFEKEGKVPSTMVPMPQLTIPGPPDRPFDPGDDWDDMYL
jgi:replication fork protection complex subunit Csm3/Swi3